MSQPSIPLDPQLPEPRPHAAALSDGEDRDLRAQLNPPPRAGLHRNDSAGPPVSPKRKRTIVTCLMVAPATISLSVGGIGIRNIVVATLLERPNQIGVPRSAAARAGEWPTIVTTSSVATAFGVSVGT